MNIEPYHLISFLCALQGTILSFLFFRKRNNRVTSLLLGAYLLIFSIGMLEMFFANTLDGWGGEMFLGFLSYSNFLYGPLMYLFITSLTVDNFCLRRKDVIHFLPFLLFWTLHTLFIVFDGKGSSSYTSTINLVVFEVLVIHLLSYNISAVIRLRQCRESILQLHPYVTAREVRWLEGFLVFQTAAYCFSFFITHMILLGFEGADQFYLMVQVLLTLLIYGMSYGILLRPSFLTLAGAGPVALSTPSSSSSSSSGFRVNGQRYSRSGLKDEQAREYASKLLNYMEVHKPFLDPALNIPSLAQKLGISRNHLTEVINEALKSNFHEFVNNYRVEEARRLIGDPEFAHFNLAALGQRAGFKSKTAFNANFKKITGMTPREWQAEKIAAFRRVKE